MDFIENVDWKFVIGDIIMPIVIFLLGMFVGEKNEKRRAKAKVKGNKNMVLQNIQITGGDKK